jgi:hypothetical protein
MVRISDFSIQESPPPLVSLGFGGSVLYYIGLLYSSSRNQNVELLHSCKWDRQGRSRPIGVSVRAASPVSRTRTPVCVTMAAVDSWRLISCARGRMIVCSREWWRALLAVPVH